MPALAKNARRIDMTLGPESATEKMDPRSVPEFSIAVRVGPRPGEGCGTAPRFLG